MKETLKLFKHSVGQEHVAGKASIGLSYTEKENHHRGWDNSKTSGSLKIHETLIACGGSYLIQLAQII